MSAFPTLYGTDTFPNTDSRPLVTGCGVVGALGLSERWASDPARPVGGQYQLLGTLRATHSHHCPFTIVTNWKHPCPVKGRRHLTVTHTGVIF